jgi:hypothetical protein
MTKVIQLFAVFIFLGTTARSRATENDFYLGTWLAGGEAAVSILGNLTITATDISWDGSRSSPKCHTTYTVVDRSNGPHPYPDEGWPSKSIPSEATYTTVKIRLAKAKCLDGAAYFRFAVASNQSDYLDVILYNNSYQPQGWFGFGRIK